MEIAWIDYKQSADGYVRGYFTEIRTVRVCMFNEQRFSFQIQPTVVIDLTWICMNWINIFICQGYIWPRCADIDFFFLLLSFTFFLPSSSSSASIKRFFLSCYRSDIVKSTPIIISEVYDTRCVSSVRLFACIIRPNDFRFHFSVVFISGSIKTQRLTLQNCLCFSTYVTLWM